MPGVGVPMDEAEVARRGRQAAGQLFLRSVVMRLITLGGVIVLARILTPAEFGVYAILTLWLTLLGFIGDMGLGGALVQQSHEPTRTELGTVLSAQLLLIVPFVAVPWLLAPIVVEPLAGPGSDLVWQLRMVSLAMVPVLLRALPSAMLLRELRFRALATIEIVQHIVFYGVAVVTVVSGAGVWGLVAALLASSVSNAVLVNLAWGRWEGISFDLSIARRQVGFGLFLQASNVAAWGRDAVIPLLGGLGGGIVAIGFLQFAYRIGTLVAAVDEIVARISFPAFSRLQGDRLALGRVVNQGVIVSGLIVAMAQIGLVALAPHLVPFAFGDQWLPAVPALQLICVGTLAFVPARFLRSLLLAHGRSRIVLVQTLTATTLIVITFPVSILALGLAAGGLAFVLGGVVLLALHARTAADLAPFPWRALGQVYLLVAIAGLVAWTVSSVLTGLTALLGGSITFLLLATGLLAASGRGPLRVAWRFVRGGQETRLAVATMADEASL